MYMPDAIKAILDLAHADSANLKRRVYNVNAMKLTPADIVESIRNYIPEFHCTYQPDYRQNIAESWPNSIDDTAAREEWNWSPEYDLDMMTRDMLQKVRAKFKKR
jgi:nucleoside-diphosphate-sugar epimerase